MDILSKINGIEILKSQLLEDVSKLHSNMAHGDSSKENVELLADMIIISYLLANDIGTSYNSLDMKIRQRLKLAGLNDNEQWANEIIDLKRHLS